jgi:hypothetical protein
MKVRIFWMAGCLICMCICGLCAAQMYRKKLWAGFAFNLFAIIVNAIAFAVRACT